VTKKNLCWGNFLEIELKFTFNKSLIIFISSLCAYVVTSQACGREFGPSVYISKSVQRISLRTLGLTIGRKVEY